MFFLLYKEQKVMPKTGVKNQLSHKCLIRSYKNIPKYYLEAMLEKWCTSLKNSAMSDPDISKTVQRATLISRNLRWTHLYLRQMLKY
jgi:hypothetical protein